MIIVTKGETIILYFLRSSYTKEIINLQEILSTELDGDMGLLVAIALVPPPWAAICACKPSINEVKH